MKLSFQADRDPTENMKMFGISGAVMIQSSIEEVLIEDKDLAIVPEVDHFFYRLAGQLRDDIYEYHRRMDKGIQFPVVRDCFCYCFAKGAESAYLWHISPNGRITFTYDPKAALTGTPTPHEKIPDDLVLEIGVGMGKMANVFVDFQDKVWLEKELGYVGAGRLTADLIACGLYWASAIGLDFGMARLGYS